MAWLTVYSQTPGASGKPPQLSLQGIEWSPRSGTHRLVIAIHPKCPCTRSSLEELSRLLTHINQRVDCLALVYHPAENERAFIDTGLVRTAKSLPGVCVVPDPDGAFAQSLNMQTSGAVALFSPEGAPLFHGGITAARGHCGPNAGSDAILALLNDEAPPVSDTHVYGCSLSTCCDKGAAR